MPAWGDLVCWQKKPRMGHKNWIPALPWLSSLFHMCPGCCHQGNVKFPLCPFFFCTQNGQDTSLNSCLRACKNFYGPSATKISKHFREITVSGSCHRCGTPSCPIAAAFQASEQFWGWELPRWRRGKLSGGGSVLWLRFAMMGVLLLYCRRE